VQPASDENLPFSSASFRQRSGIPVGPSNHPQTLTLRGRAPKRNGLSTRALEASLARKPGRKVYTITADR